VEGAGTAALVFTTAAGQPLTGGVAVGVVAGARSAAAPVADLLAHVAGASSPQYAIAARDKCGLKYQVRRCRLTLSNPR